MRRPLFDTKPVEKTTPLLPSLFCLTAIILQFAWEVFYPVSSSTINKRCCSQPNDVFLCFKVAVASSNSISESRKFCSVKSARLDAGKIVPPAVITLKHRTTYVLHINQYGFKLAFCLGPTHIKKRCGLKGQRRLTSSVVDFNGSFREEWAEVIGAHFSPSSFRLS